MINVHRSQSTQIALAVAALGFAAAAQAQWVNLVNDTTTRMPTIGAGANDPATSTADTQEKDYAWGDVNKDGWIDLVVVRKIPFTHEGGRTNVLFMNENGVLKDRTTQYATAAINVPAPYTSQGFLDLTNDRDVLLVDVNNDGWLDMVTATTLSDNLPRYIGHPRIYINQGEVDGVWQGFVYDYDRIPQLRSKINIACNPRFCSVTAGDLTGNGFVDLYFGDYDHGDVGPPVNWDWDMDNKLLINSGAANPGSFVDEGSMRMGSTLLLSAFGAASIIADMNGDGLKDVVKQTSLQSPTHVAVKVNNPNNPGSFLSSGHKIVYTQAPYFVSSGDLNGDGRMDLVISDDSVDKYMINTGNEANGNPIFTTHNFLFSSGSPANSGFAGNSVVADLDKDGWPDVVITDVDVDIGGCSRRTRLYRNLGNAPTVTLREQTPAVIPNADLIGVHDIAVFDINNDGWLDMVIGRCNNTQVWMSVPLAAAAFEYPNSRPESVTPNQATTFELQLSNVIGGAVSTPRIYVSQDGELFTPIVLTSLGGNLFTVPLPAIPCASNLRYYMQVTINGRQLTDPPIAGAYYSTYAGTGTQTIADQNFEGTVRDWNVVNDPSLTGGAWEVTAPVGTWNEGVRAAPGANYTAGGSKAFVTQNGAVGGAVGEADVDGGPTHLISPVIDLANSNGVVSVAYWFFSSNHPTPASTDVLNVSVSNDDGATWTTVANLKAPKSAEPNSTPAQDNAWKNFSFTVGDFVNPTSQVRVRFTANDVAPAGIVEAGIDDFKVDKINCASICQGDITGDNVVNIDDLFMVINNWGAAGGPADITGDGMVNIDDLFAVINAWGACP